MARVRKGQKPAARKRRLLIVTEDSVASTRYFQEVRYDAGLDPSRVVVDGGSGSDPLSVVERVLETWDEEARGLRPGELPFERAFAVVDRDEHDAARFGQAREQLRQRDANVRMALREAADKARQAGDDAVADALARQARRSVLTFSCSYPCFEYWLLLHFGYSRAAIVRKGQKTPAQVALSALRSSLPMYTKGGTAGLWTQTKPLYATAKRHAVQSRREAKQTSRPNPSTDIDMVLEAIFKLGQQS